MENEVVFIGGIGGQIARLPIMHGKRPDYKVLQAMVGGLIETVPHLEKFDGRPCVAYMNEEARMLDLPVNEAATKLWLENLGDGPFRYTPEIMGPMVLLVGDAWFRGEMDDPPLPSED